MIIRNFQDVANYFALDEVDEKKISHRLYKHTNCGAWLQFVRLGTKKVKQRWHALLRFSAMDTKTVEVHSVKKGGRWNAHNDWITPFAPSVPREVHNFLSIEAVNPHIPLITWNEIVAHSNKTNCEYVIHPNTTVISFTTEHNVEVPMEGVMIGTIVEGSDVEPAPITLHFPFSEKKLRDAIKDIEAEAEDIWVEANLDTERDFE